MKDYIFHTTCVQSTYELITEMRELARESTYHTLLKHCEGLSEVFRELGYGRDVGLHPSRDWAITWAKSRYAGQPCYYFVWSHIEHIWLHRDSDWEEVQLREHETRRNPPDALSVRGGVNDVDNLESMYRPGHAYRGMTYEEYHATLAVGKGVKSRGDYSFSREGTSFADHPADAESYVNFGRDDPRKTGRPTYLVEVVQAGLRRDRDGYLKTVVEVPRERVTRVWEMFPREGVVYAVHLGR